MSAPAVWLADAVGTTRGLAPTDAVGAQIAVMLGLRAPPSSAPSPLPPVAHATRVEAAPDAASTADQTPAVHRGAVAPPIEHADEQVAVIEPERPATSARAPVLLPELTDVLPVAPALDLGPATLLAPALQRSLLGALCSQPSPGDELDDDELVERLARRDPLRALPRRPVRTTRRGLQLLVDFGPGLRGFQRDRDDVWQLISRLAGADGFEVLRFAVTPLDAPGAGPRLVNTWKQYEPPAWGRPVLVLSDLGTGSPLAERGAVIDRWLRFAALARAAGCPVTALVPAAERNIPVRLRRALAVVVWDRPTTVRHAIAAARRAGSRVHTVDR